MSDQSDIEIILIAAIGENRELGYDNKLLWHLPGDLPRFKNLTSGHAIIMGRKTFDSIGKPLPNRLNIVLSRNTDLAIDGTTVVSNLEQAIRLAEQHGSGKLFVIGGGEIYSLFLPIATTLELTLVSDSPKHADAYFPDYQANHFEETSRQVIDDNDPSFSYVTLNRITG
jgi:dihydrofolate reductase